MPIKHANRAKVTISSRWDVSKARLIIAAFLHVWNDAHCHHACLLLPLTQRNPTARVADENPIHRRRKMKVRSLVILIASAISFALPTGF
jgi:hypothetical protein